MGTGWREQDTKLKKDESMKANSFITYLVGWQTKESQKYKL